MTETTPTPENKSPAQTKIDVVKSNLDLPEDVTQKLDRIATARLSVGETLPHGTDVTVEVQLMPNPAGREMQSGVSYSTRHLPATSSVRDGTTRTKGMMSTHGFIDKIIPTERNSLKDKVNTKVRQSEEKEKKQSKSRFAKLLGYDKAKTPQDVWCERALRAPTTANHLVLDDLLHTDGSVSTKDVRGVEVTTITNATTVITHQLRVSTTNYGHHSLASTLKKKGSDGFVAGQEVYDQTPQEVMASMDNNEFAPPYVNEQVIITTSDAQLADKLKSELANSTK